MAQAVAALSVRQRAVIVLTYWLDLHPAGIATLLRVSEGSVRRHLARARARLREVLRARPARCRPAGRGPGPGRGGPVAPAVPGNAHRPAPPPSGSAVGCVSP
ncbi:MAG: sigma factor-like helix-turn-helix DNA-binding protein, partial [Acidimicrobiales bacterium]